MDHRSVYVAGTGTFAADVRDYATAAGLTVTGLIELIDVSRIGAQIDGLTVRAPEHPPTVAAAAVIGLSRDRLEFARILHSHGWAPVSVVHPTAVLSPSAQLGPGVIVGPLSVLGAGSKVGAMSLIGRGALIGHHVELGEGVVVNPGANIGGNTLVGSGVRIGIGATVVDSITIGEGAVIAAGAVVVRDAPAWERMQGVPARVFRDDAVRSA